MNSPHDPLTGFILEGSGAHVSVGWLLSPEAFAQECTRTRQRPAYDSWALHTQLPDAVLRTMESPLVPSAGALGFAVSEQGMHYPIVTMQGGGTQLRMLLSLADVQTQKWFAASLQKAS